MMAHSENWDVVGPGKLVSHRFAPGQKLVSGLASFAEANRITRAVIVSCIGSVTDLRLRNLSGFDPNGNPQFQDHDLSEVMEIVSAEGNIVPLPDGGIRTHIHVVAARPSGEVIGGHCEEATICTGGYMFLHVLETQ